LLDGNEYLAEINEELTKQAEKENLVVVFSQSDNLMEFRGAIYDEVGCYDGGFAYLNHDGLLENKCDDDECPHFFEQKMNAIKIEACWGDDDDYCWTYKTDIPHETFSIMEDHEKYCRGIVFSNDDLKSLIKG